jgi:hypothetical protein
MGVGRQGDKEALRDLTTKDSKGFHKGAQRSNNKICVNLRLFNLRETKGSSNGTLEPGIPEPGLLSNIICNYYNIFGLHSSNCYIFDVKTGL